MPYCYLIPRKHCLSLHYHQFNAQTNSNACLNAVRQVSGLLKLTRMVFSPQGFKMMIWPQLSAVKAW